MTKIRKKGKQLKKGQSSPFSDYWTNTHYLLLGFGLLIVVFGFILMTAGPYDNPTSLTLSPIVLLVAYIIIFPISIFYKRKKNKRDNVDNVSG